MRVWLEYIPSGQNIADLPSRDKLSELFKVYEAVSENGEWTEVVYEECKIPDFSSWRVPSGQQRKRVRSGGRGAKRAKKR